MLQAALAFHLEGLRAEGLPIPPPSTVAYVEVAARPLDLAPAVHRYAGIDAEVRYNVNHLSAYLLTPVATIARSLVVILTGE
jgi:hypothetical protein